MDWLDFRHRRSEIDDAMAPLPFHWRTSLLADVAAGARRCEFMPRFAGIAAA
jgi:hypothetical protein